MYSSSPSVNDALDLGKVEQWLATVDMRLIASFGIYGGEVSINLEKYEEILNLLPPSKPRFCITNGTWSVEPSRALEFVQWCARHRLFVVISGTPEHRKHQNRALLETYASAYPNAIRLKPVEEQFHPMGRLEGAFPVNCSVKCMWWQRALRIAVQPDGTVVFQNCDGMYPIVGTIDQSFSVLHRNIQHAREEGFDSVCKFYKGVGANE
jgi:hypothetical protein